MSTSDKHTTPPTIPQQGKHIAYDRISRDYVAHLDGVLVGYFRSYFDAEQELDRFAFEASGRGQEAA